MDLLSYLIGFFNLFFQALERDKLALIVKNEKIFATLFLNFTGEFPSEIRSQVEKILIRKDSG